MSYSFLPLCFTPFPRLFVCSCTCIVYCVLCELVHWACIILWKMCNYATGLLSHYSSEIRLAKLQHDLGLTPFPLFLCPLLMVVTLSK